MKTFQKTIKRLGAYSAAISLALLCSACGGPEPVVYEMDIPGLAAEQQAAGVIAQADTSETTAEALTH